MTVQKHSWGLGGLQRKGSSVEESAMSFYQGSSFCAVLVPSHLLKYGGQGFAPREHMDHVRSSRALSDELQI